MKQPHIPPGAYAFSPIATFLVTPAAHQRNRLEPSVAVEGGLGFGLAAVSVAAFGAAGLLALDVFFALVARCISLRGGAPHRAEPPRSNR